MQLTAEQLEAVKNGQPLRFTAPETNSDFVVLRADDYERLRAMLLGEDADPEDMYPLLADIAPEDWEDATLYGIPPEQR